LRRFLQFDALRAPQFAAAGLLLVYLLQCASLVRTQTLHGLLPDIDRSLRISRGLEQWKGNAIAGTPQTVPSEVGTDLAAAGRAGYLRGRDGYDLDRSPLYYLIASAPTLLCPDSWLPQYFWPLLATAPDLFFGFMLGASLWYVARRLYGNAGAYIALSLYCFSPAVIVNVAGSRSLGEMGAVSGAFGTIFTAIAVAHTLYAPREVVVWNWRRILLLGLSLTLAIGNQFSLAALALLTLLLMLWVVPVRQRAVLAIWIAASSVAGLLLFASYFFEPALFSQGMLHARWVDFEPAAFAMYFSYDNTLRWVFVGSPPLMLALPLALSSYFGWKRARYFGNTAPLLIATLLFVLALGAPNFPGRGFHLGCLVFLFVFVGGVFADLLETRQNQLVTAGLCGLLGASALWNLCTLWRL